MRACSKSAARCLGRSLTRAATARPCRPRAAAYSRHYRAMAPRAVRAERQKVPLPGRSWRRGRRDQCCLARQGLD